MKGQFRFFIPDNPQRPTPTPSTTPRILHFVTSVILSADFDFGNRFCIDNGIMIAHAGLLSYRMGYTTPLEDTTITQRCVLSSFCAACSRAQQFE